MTSIIMHVFLQIFCLGVKYLYIYKQFIIATKISHQGVNERLLLLDHGTRRLRSYELDRDRDLDRELDRLE